MKTLFICEHNLARSQMACAFYNHLTDTNDAISAGISVEVRPEKTLGEFSEKTRTVRVMQEIGLDLTNALRQQLNLELTQGVDQIISFLPISELPQWLKNDPRTKVWRPKYYPASDIALVQQLRDDIETLVQELIANK